MDNNKKFEESCYNFQKSIIDIFNEEKLPFLLKYYLIKEIWEDIERYKVKSDQEMRVKMEQNKDPSKQEEKSENT